MPEDRLKVLVDLAKTDKNAFGELYRLYYDKVYHYFLRRSSHIEQSLDMTSECFFKVLENIFTFEYRNKESFEGWIFKIAANLLNSHYIQSKKFTDEPEFEIKDEESQIGELEKELDNTLLKDKMYMAIKQLTNVQQEIVELKVMQELPYETISEITGMNVNTLKSHMNRATEKLQALLKTD